MKIKHHTLFTMIELIVVMAIIGVMMLIAVPAVTKINVDSLDSYCERIASLFEAARTQAMITGKPTEVKVDPIGRQITGNATKTNDVSGVDLSNDFSVGESDESKQYFAASVVLPEWIYISIESPPDKLTFKFYPDGTASIPRITLQEDEDVRYITVRPLTGRVNIDTIKR